MPATILFLLNELFSNNDTTKRRSNETTLGFTLVELIVSLAITAIIMVGLSVFFANSFHNVFQTQEQLTQTQGQFVLNEIIRDKLADLDELKDYDENDILFKNKITKDQLPFTYMAQSGDRLVFSDFFEFKGRTGPDSSSSFTLKNPAGITVVGSTYYVAVPLEDKIYECTNETTCTDFEIPNLSQPIDIETDGTNLFVSDAGNNRVIKITLPAKTITVLAENLNYPTGLAFYGADNQLFISDTYNNRVVKIPTNLGTYPVPSIPIAGEGEDETCDDITAKYCKLNFPTGLAIDTVSNELYIADSGNDRILKITDPDVDLSSYKVNFTLTDEDAPTQISQINFSFPTADTLNISEISNTLHDGRYNLAGKTYAYLLSTSILNGDATLEDCDVPPENPCNYSFERFTVASENNFFVSLENIKLSDTEYMVNGTPAFMGDYYEVYVLPVGLGVSYPAGTIAKLTNDFTAGSYEFDFNLADPTDSIFSKSFNSVNVEIFDGDKNSIKKVAQVIRIGDDTLGTLEDLIEVYLSGLDYPTGLSISAGLQKNEGVDFNELGVDFDYVSDFEITDLTFTKFNEGDILQAIIETAEQTYTITTNVAN